MLNSIFIPLLVASAFSQVFLWLFLPHRYRESATLAINFGSFLLTAILAYIISRHIPRAIDSVGLAAAVLDILILLSTAMLIGVHRDSRSLFIGLSAGTYSLAALIYTSLVYFYSGSRALTLTGQVAFSVGILAILCKNNRDTPLTDLLSGKEGRGQLCFIPLISFVSIFVPGVWPGNIFMIPVCRPISVIMIALMFLNYHLIILLLRTQLKSAWLNGSNEILESCARGLQQQISRMKQEEEEVSILRHDIRHRNSLILFYLDTGNLDEIRRMAESTGERLESTVVKRYCADGTLNWILTQAAQKAEKSGVRFSCAADVPALPEDLEFELGVVVLNLLENALRAAAAFPEQEKRFVQFSARPVKGQLFLETANPFAGTLRFSSETCLPLSSGGGEGHGHGLCSVLAFAKKHDASFDCHAEKNVFHVRLLIPLK